MKSKFSPHGLAALGWTPAEEAAFAGHAARGLVPGRVTLEHTHLYRVCTADAEWLARVAGRLRHAAVARRDFPAVGDWVALDPPPAGGRATIRAVLPRRSAFRRKVAGSRTDEQVVAANIDTVFLVMGLDADFNLRRLERYVLLARDSGASAVVVLNKVDVCGEVAARVAEVAAIAQASPVLAVSGRTGAGLDALRASVAPRRTVAFLGSSGVGKSTIINRLVGSDLLPTREIRAADGRGRHASANRQLVVLPNGGLVIDTPGMRELQLWEVGGVFAGTFDDIEALAPGCRFRDCRHREEPGCAVRAAVDGGRLSAGRLENYRKLDEERRHLAEKQDEQARLARKRRDKAIHRAARQHKPRG